MTPPAVQLEVAAQWLKEAAMLLVGCGGKKDSEQFTRVAADCLAVAKGMEDGNVHKQ